jgi:hypothetical protein
VPSWLDVVVVVADVAVATALLQLGERATAA